MRRTLLVWTTYCVAFAIIASALAWVTRHALQAEARERAAAWQAECERLALWRMDSAVMPLIALESARPHFAYSSFYGAPQAFTRLMSPLKTEDVQLPSDLLQKRSTYISIYFQCDPESGFTSPQVPRSNDRDVAEQVLTSPKEIRRSQRVLEELEQTLGIGELRAVCSLPNSNRPRQAVPPGKETADFAQRWLNVQQSNRLANGAPVQSGQLAVPPSPTATIDIGSMTPFWKGDRLFLARRIAENDREWFQGCQLDWPALQDWLCEQVDDLLPEARVAPAELQTAPDLMMAALPIQLLPGPAIPQAQPAAGTPLAIGLWLTWISLAITASAVAVMLASVLRMADRREAFVSAVSHELRTPLTSLRLYSDLIERLNPSEEAKRSQYVSALQTESQRLSHLVENVLTYSRLEKQATPVPEPVRWATIWRRVELPIRQMLERAEMRLVGPHAGDCGSADTSAARHPASSAPEASSSSDPWVLGDPAAIERILVNLVDNACKYGRHPDHPEVEIQIQSVDSQVWIDVVDRGPGFVRQQRQGRFRPFQKGASEAARSAPGIGLGLSLCQRLARQMGGELEIPPAETNHRRVRPGAVVRLKLKAAVPEQPTESSC